MEYVFVGGKPTFNNQVDYTYESVNQARNLLISLIDILNSGAFHPNHFYNQLHKMSSIYRKDTQFKNFIDSGGYSVIVGDVLAQNVSEFIDKYVMCAQIGAPTYDAIFSLDIPIFLKQPNYNTKYHIEEFNRISLTKTLNAAVTQPEILDKLYFVWHFKIKDQYDIWCKLYDELNINEKIKNRALGGMVGLRGITQIDFSPFIGPAYRLLLDYTEGNTDVPFIMHCLGIYIQHDRFFLVLMEDLFNRYLQREDSHITYDSVNYMRTAQLRAKNLRICTFQSGTKLDYYDHIYTPDDVLREAYTNNLAFDAVKEEIKRVQANVNLKNIDAFTPLNIYSNVQMDKFFKYIIDKYHIVDDIMNNPMRIKNTLVQIGAAHPTAFTPARIRSLRANFNKLLPFHFWFTRSKNRDELRSLMYSFIEDIQFPATLADGSEQLQQPSSAPSWSTLNNFNQFAGECDEQGRPITNTGGTGGTGESV